jgi:hypothetical protein
MKENQKVKKLHIATKPLKSSFKGINHDKRGGLKVASFDPSHFKLFTVKFSHKSVQASSCEF